MGPVGYPLSRLGRLGPGFAITARRMSEYLKRDQELAGIQLVSEGKSYLFSFWFVHVQENVKARVF